MLALDSKAENTLNLNLLELYKCSLGKKLLIYNAKLSEQWYKMETELSYV